MGKISLKKIIEMVEKDLQSLDNNVMAWIVSEENKHPDKYTIDELCYGVEEGTVPYEMLWYVLIYCNISDEEKDKIRESLEIGGKSNSEIKDSNIRFSYDVGMFCSEIYKSKYVKNSRKVSYSDYVNASYSVTSSCVVNASNQVYASQNIDRSKFIGESSNIRNSCFIEKSKDIDNCLFCSSCENFKNGLFCAFIKNEENDYYIFNKKVSKEEFDNIKKILYTHFRKIFEEGANVKERDIVAFKKYCTIIPGYDYSLFEYLLESVFEYWVAELKK